MPVSLMAIITLAGLGRRVEPGVSFVERDVKSLKRELAAVGHCVARVHGQVHDDLLDLSGVGFDSTQIRAGDHYHVDVFADQAIQQLEIFCNYRVQVEDFGGEHLLAAEGQQLASECGGAVGGVGDLLCRAAQLRI